MLLEDVPVVVAVASGKGGVGKTRIAADLARTLNRQGNTVGLLDADISTPNILQEVAGEDVDVSQARMSDGEHLLPVEVDGIHLFSQGLHLDDDVALLRGGGWRAESITNYIHTVDWPDETTHIVVDSPPGNGTEIQTVLAEAAPDYGFIVTTGANHSVRDARRTHELFIDADLPHTVIANMRRVELRPDWDGIREGVVDEVDGVGESRAETIVDIVEASIDGTVSLHDDGVDLEDRIDADVVADVPFTTDASRRQDVLLDAIATIPEPMEAKS